MDKRVPPSSSLEQFWSRRNGQKSARELRQGGSDYRCCIPALAGFVSPQSIVPDGEQIFSQNRQRASPSVRGQICELTRHHAFVSIAAVKWTAILLLGCIFAAANSCT